MISFNGNHFFVFRLRQLLLGNRQLQDPVSIFCLDVAFLHTVTDEESTARTAEDPFAADIMACLVLFVLIKALFGRMVR